MKIFIIMQRRWARLYGFPLVESIKKKYPDCIIDTMAYKIGTYNLVKKRKDLFNKIWLGYKYDDNINDINYSKDFDKISIEEIEKDLQIDSVWKNLIHVDRSIIYTPGRKWRYSYRQQVSDDDSLKIVKLNYLLVKNEIFGDKKPDLIILPNFGSMFHNVLYHYAKVNKVDCWMPIASKISNRVVLTNCLDYSLNNIFKDFQNYEPKPEALDFSKEYLDNFRKEVIKPVHLDYKNDPHFNIYNFYKNFFLRLLKLPLSLYRHYKRNIHKLNPKVYRTTDSIKTHQVFFNFFSEYYNLFSLKLMKYDKLEKIGKFAYFPLHLQPEVSTNLWAPIFTNLSEVIRQIAISLPSEITLVVKEHPIMLGRRSKKYFEKLRSLPNVKVLDPSIQTNDIINNKNCKLVSVVSGTTAFEAGILGKKVIQFTDTFWNILPNVRTCTDLTRLTEEIKKIGEFDEKKTLFMLSFLYENSFALSYSLAYRKYVDPQPYVDAMMLKIEEVYLDKI